MKLSPKVLSQIATGHVVNLLANDTEFFEVYGLLLPFFYIGSLVILATMVTFVSIYGIIGLIAVALFLLLILVQGIIYNSE